MTTRVTKRARQLGTLLLTMIACTAWPSGALAAEGDPFLQQCFSSTALAPCTQLAAPPITAVDIEISPDGQQLYMLGRFPVLIRLFDRDPATNRLTARVGAAGCYNASGADGCTAVAGFSSGDVYDLDLSPDGSSIYVANAGSLSHLQRDLSTGALTPRPCYGSGAGCTPIGPITSVMSAVVSEDGHNVYTRGNSSLGAFQRNPATGALVPEPDGEDCFSENAAEGCTDSYGLMGHSFEMGFSPDGRFLYYPIQSSGGIGFFQRSLNGSLSQIAGPQGGCITTNGSSTAAGECATLPDGSGPAMSNAWAATVSPSGRHAFVSGSSGTVIFSRNQDDGKLTKADCLSPAVVVGCKQRRGSGGMGARVSPDGKRLVVGGNDIGGFGVYDFDATTGQATQLPDPFGCFSGAETAGCSVLPGYGSYSKSAWGANGLNFYVARGTLLNIVLDYKPRCVDVSGTVPFQTSMSFQLSCSDPNHDPLTFAISRQPFNGVLGGVDPGGLVRYNPFLGYVGADSFQYTATGRGVSSAPATVSLNVQVPPPAPAATAPAPVTLGASAAAPARCVVPKLKGKTLKRAKAMLKKARCGVGKVKVRRTKAVRPGRVVAQSRAPGKRLAVGSKVNIVIARRA